jgi:beta-phosphoglucomutase-like phosphatase (HAD superfamily)
VVVTIDHVTRGKPAPDVYLEAAQRLRVEAAECLVLEDSDVGILAARSAGMVPVLSPDLKVPSEAALAAAHFVLDSLHDALPLVASFLTRTEPA